MWIPGLLTKLEGIAELAASSLCSINIKTQRVSETSYDLAAVEASEYSLFRNLMKFAPFEGTSLSLLIHLLKPFFMSTKDSAGRGAH